MDLGLQGKYAVVAGGGRGIGKAIALELAREGADVVICSRNGAELTQTAIEINAATRQRIFPIVMDVTKTAEVNNGISEAAQKLGGLHILINSAALPGGSPNAIGPIETVDDTSLIYDFNVKYVGALRCSRAAIPFMKKEGWGRIVNISGGNARIAGNLSGGARNVSLVHLTKTLSDQLGRYGITVNCIHPGTTRTERTPALLSERAKQDGITLQQVEKADFDPESKTTNSIGRMVDAQEIGYLTAFLASDKSWAITGEVIGAGGGSGKAVYY